MNDIGKSSNDAEPLITRRQFTDVAAASVLAAFGFSTPTFAEHAARALGRPGSGPADATSRRAFLTEDEERFIVAAVGRLIPAEGDGPGAVEAGVPNFIDKQLGGEWGKGERLFMGGPFYAAAIPELGYQLSYAPAELFRRSIRKINQHLSAIGTPFWTMPEKSQDEFLHRDLESGKIGDLDGIPARVFFDHLLELTIEGYFSDPVYGGNNNMVAWKAIGFPGAYASYRQTVGQHGKTFSMAPVSLSDHDHIPSMDQHSMESQI